MASPKAVYYFVPVAVIMVSKVFSLIFIINQYFSIVFFNFSFFLEKSSIGKSRAQVAKELLQELNSDVKGDFVEEVS